MLFWPSPAAAPVAPVGPRPVPSGVIGGPTVAERNAALDAGADNVRAGMKAPVPARDAAAGNRTIGGPAAANVGGGLAGPAPARKFAESRKALGGEVGPIRMVRPSAAMAGAAPGGQPTNSPVPDILKQ